MAKLSIRDLSSSGKHVLMRVDFNVPLDGERITDDTRIRAALPSIKFLTDQGARLILMSHLGSPKGVPEDNYSLKPVAGHLEELVDNKVYFADDCIGEDVENLAAQLGDGEILLLENLRFHPGEEANDTDFAAQLAKLADIFVNDAFGTSHREHASMVGVPRLASQAAMGFLIERELEYLVEKLENPKRPFVVIMGGAKVSDKINILKRLMPIADYFIIGGAMATTFRLAEGYEVGQSYAERTEIGLEVAREILGMAQELEMLEEDNKRFLLPADTRYCWKNEEGAPTAVTELWEEGGAIPLDAEGIDIGDQAIEEFSKVIALAGTVFWNGPMGVFEKEGFDIGTRAIGEAIANNTEAVTIVGGGDSVTAANQFGFGERMDHLSTGGGASLKLLEGKELPGIAALHCR